MTSCFLKSMPARSANAWSRSQLLSSGPPAMASFLSLRSRTLRIDDCNRCHHRAKRGRSRIKHECIAKRALASNPQPIGENEVDRAALERHLARFGRCKLEGIDDKVKFPFNAVPFDDVKFPRQGSGLLHGDANAISLGNCGPKHNDGNQPKTQHGPHRATMPYPLTLANRG